MGRHAAAAALHLSGTLHVRDDHGNQIQQFRFWHGPQERWRIESVDGQVLYLRGSANDCFVRTDDGELQRQAGDFGAQWLGPLSPLDLLGPNSLPHQMSTKATLKGPPATTLVDSRPAHSVVFGSNAGQVEFAFDDESGLLVRLHNPSNGATVEVSGLTLHDVLPDETFRWDGPTTLPDATHSPFDRRR